MKYTPVYIRKTVIVPQQKIYYRPGQYIGPETVEDGFKFLRIVPDSDHQSSLDYLKGV